VVDAVRCADEIQRGMAEQNIDVPQDKQIEVRIGIHVGDIIIEENDSRPRARPRHIWSKVGFAREFRLADNSGRQGKAVLAARSGDKREDLCAEQQLRDLFPERGIRMLDITAILPSCTEAAASAV
jgi:hypothetical protein